MLYAELGLVIASREWNCRVGFAAGFDGSRFPPCWPFGGWQ